jgi:hypothetical protein
MTASAASPSVLASTIREGVESVMLKLGFLATVAVLVAGVCARAAWASTTTFTERFVCEDRGVQLPLAGARAEPIEGRGDRIEDGGKAERLAHGPVKPSGAG